MVFPRREPSASLLNTADLRGVLILSVGLVFSSGVLAITGNHVLSLVAVVGGVLLTRYLFFVSVVPLNMALTFVRAGEL